VALELGAMSDVLTALEWARHTLPQMALSHPYIRPDGDRVVSVGWSTGGMLAMSLGWTAVTREVKPPNAILAFYSPTNYADAFWARPNFPNGTEQLASTLDYTVREGLYGKPITAYNVPNLDKLITGGWMATEDVRSRIALHMNWKAQTLPVLLGAFALRDGDADTDANAINGDSDDDVETTGLFAQPSHMAISRINPHTQIQMGTYKTPTCLVHGSLDDLIPVSQVRGTYAELQKAGVVSRLVVVEGARHLFDSGSPPQVREAVRQGYEFLTSFVGK
jgi:acetyl esterase/lipase